MKEKSRKGKEKLGEHAPSKGQVEMEREEEKEAERCKEEEDS